MLNQKINTTPNNSKKLEEDFSNQDTFLKRGVWVYFFLLIFEGALRKWFLPGLATPLLIIRDPLAIVLILTAWQKGLLSANIFLLLSVVIGFIALLTAIFLGHENVYVAIYGARIFVIQFPFMFVIAAAFSRKDVIEMGKATLWISIGMVILIAIQFYSPQSAWVNVGVGGEGSSGFSGAEGYFRPSGTFSFTNGISLFFPFCAVFVWYFSLNMQEINKTLVICAAIATVVAIPLSISRGLFFSIGVVSAFVFMAITRKPGYLGKMIFVIVILFIVLNLVSKLPFVETAVHAFTARFEHANEAEGGLESVLVDRYLGGMVGALNSKTGDLPLMGYGIGMGSNVGSQLLTGGTTFLISEGEWGRLIGEMGAFMGLLMILVRVLFSFNLLRKSYEKLSEGDFLSWFLLSIALITIPQGAWGQPTPLGFAILIGGLMMASWKNEDEK